MIIYYKNVNGDPDTIEPDKIIKSNIPGFLAIEFNKHIFYINFNDINLIDFDLKSTENLIDLDNIYGKD
jgi:hypothetical protein